MQGQGFMVLVLAWMVETKYNAYPGLALSETGFGSCPAKLNSLHASGPSTPDMIKTTNM